MIVHALPFQRAFASSTRKNTTSIEKSIEKKTTKRASAKVADAPYMIITHGVHYAQTGQNVKNGGNHGVDLSGDAQELRLGANR